MSLITRNSKLMRYIFIVTILLVFNHAESQTGLQNTVAAKYPLFSSTPIATAQLTELPEGVIIRSGDISITEQELEIEISQSPENMRQQLRNNVFFILEQKFTEKVILEESRKSLSEQEVNISSMPDMQIIQAFIRSMVDDIEPTEAEIADFYAANKDLMGGMPLERATGQISAFLKQQQQQQMVQHYVTNAVSTRQVQICAGWASEKIPLALNNEVDQARISGKPTMANFGSDSCVPCQMMIPAREAIIEKFGDTANVVYVHVDRDQILSTRYGVQSIPTLIFFDTEGNETHSHIGMMSEEEMEERLNEMLR